MGTATGIIGVMKIETLPARVQRVVEAELPVLHLEPEIPVHDGSLTVGGLVARPLVLTRERIERLPRHDRQVDLHCTWGWSRVGVTWQGVLLDDILALSPPDPRATHVQLVAAGREYQTCLTLADARAGIIALAMDGVPLTPEHGAPMRFITPPTLWGFKGPKWLAEICLTDHFAPGFWEVGVNDPNGRVPEDVLARMADFAALRTALEGGGKAGPQGKPR